jgi:Uma2 family endonuclease
VPDLSGWRVERVPELPEDNPIAIVPDFCAEVLSPTTARDDRLVKLPLYARSGVAWIWLVDPSLRAIEVYETANGLPALRRAAKDRECAELPPFVHEIDLTGWWLPES